MRDLRFTGLTPEGDLILADADGDPYRVAADARLVDALGVAPVEVSRPPVLRPVPDASAPQVHPTATDAESNPAVEAAGTDDIDRDDTVAGGDRSEVAAAREVTEIVRPRGEATVTMLPERSAPTLTTPEVIEVIEVIDLVRASPVTPAAPVRPAVPPLRPREIQARIRAGASVEDVARESGMDAEKVARYAGPPLAERAYIAERARGTEIRRHDGGQTLEDAVVARLVLRGSDASDLIWDSWRRDDARWTITLEFADGEAAWLFDPEGRSLVAADEQAHTLTGSGPAPDLERPRLQSVDEARPARTQPTPVPRVDAPAAEPVRPERVLPDPVLPDPVRPEPPRTTTVPQVAARPVPEPAPAPAPASDPAPPRPIDPPAVSYDELASAMRAGADRGSRPVDPVRDEPGSRAQPAPHDKAVSPEPPAPEDEPQSREHLAPESEPEPAPNPPAPARPSSKARKAKRASVPSWDEIVFGARPDDST